MTKTLLTVAAAAAVALTAVPAAAAPVLVGPENGRQATATARIVKPLKLFHEADLDLGTIILSGAGPFTATVGVDAAGAFDCTDVNLTCSGLTSRAEYTVTGTNNQTVTVNVDDVELSHDVTPAVKLMMTVDAPATINLGNSGNAGYLLGIGGSISVSDTTLDGTYTGTFNLTVNY